MEGDRNSRHHIRCQFLKTRFTNVDHDPLWRQRIYWAAEGARVPNAHFVGCIIRRLEHLLDIGLGVHLSRADPPPERRLRYWKRIRRSTIRYLSQPSCQTGAVNTNARYVRSRSRCLRLCVRNGGDALLSLSMLMRWSGAAVGMSTRPREEKGVIVVPSLRERCA